MHMPAPVATRAGSQSLPAHPCETNRLRRQSITGGQAKVSASAPDDTHGFGASSVAKRMTDVTGPKLQRSFAACAEGNGRCSKCEEEDREGQSVVHRKAHNSGVMAGSAVVEDF